MSHVEQEPSHRSRDLNDDGRNELDRRDFLVAAGFSLAAVAAGCSRAPVSEAVPYVVAPEEIVPGRSYAMASTCHGCPARCGILVKCRDGRPIKIEGNPEHPLSRGGLCAVGQATVLGLYDTMRLGGPLVNGRAADWTLADRTIAEKLATAKHVRVLSSTLASPTTKRVIDEFLARFDDGKHGVYDVPSASALREAHGGVLPHYRFDKADLVLSLDADFLGTWLSPVEFTKQWSSRRGTQRHVQYESRLSLTGSKADKRVRVAPHEIPALNIDVPAGRSLIVAGSNRVDVQRRVRELNEAHGNYGSTIELDTPSYQREGSDPDLAQLFAEPVDVLFVVDANPVYDLAQGEALLQRVPFVVSLATHHDETTKLADVVCPPPHFLESWNDSMPVAGVYSVTQPAIAPLRKTREVMESFAAWSGRPVKAYELVRATSLAADWDKTLHDGFAFGVRQPQLPRSNAAASLPGSATESPQLKAAAGAAALQIVLYPSIAQLDGRHAHNAWLHELPDPITKVTWDNVASLSPAAAKRFEVQTGDVVSVDGVELPVYVQPGQHDGVVAIALGYGRAGTDRFAKIGPQWLLARTHLTPGGVVGASVSKLMDREHVSVKKTGKRHELATTQLEARFGDRPAPFRKSEIRNQKSESLWPAKAKGVHAWGMAIDLAKCTGCSACVIGCQSENNVPVVGRDEVLREREMHWMRIDRYYEGEGDELAVAHQPMMCAHCGNAPCETVCPVLATVHSSDGLNQQVYNRCVGTRYCANNCPYKVRRFNWFDYPHEDRFANLVLNPDVAVRSRGVMEKCSMCVQRIEEARIVAKQQGVPIPDGAIRTACEQSCPADAIVFGDANDPKSRIAKVRRDGRYFVVLEELNVQPAVGYMEA